MSWCHICRNEHYFDDECPGQKEGPQSASWKEELAVQKEFKSDEFKKEIEKTINEADKKISITYSV